MRNSKTIVAFSLVIGGLFAGQSVLAKADSQAAVTFETAAKEVLTPCDSSVQIACWGKKKNKASSADGSQKIAKKDKDDSRDDGRSPRPTTGKKVDLVEGMPPFLFWDHEGDSKGVVLCLHELGMHSGVFEDAASKLRSSGYDVYSMDLRGFGGWSEVKGAKGKMNLKNTLGDIKSAAETLKKKSPDTKIFLLGEAMGGALALEAAAKYPDIISGAISSAPGGEHFNTVSNYLSVGSRFAAGNRRFDKGEELIKVATPKKELQEAFRKDSNVRLDLAPGELMACQFYMYKTKRFAREIRELPVMIVQGLKDGESRPEGAKKIYDNLATKDKEYLSVEEGDHYVFEDTKVDDKAMNATIAWLDKYSTR